MSCYTVVGSHDADHVTIETDTCIRMVPSRITLIGSEYNDHKDTILHTGKKDKFRNLWQEIFPSQFPLP